MENTNNLHEEELKRVCVDLGFNPEESVDTAIKADRMMYAISHIEKKIEYEKQCKAEAVDFYDNRISSLQNQIDFLKSKIQLFLYDLKEKGVDAKASGPNGTASLVKRKKQHLPDDQTLIDFSKYYHIKVKVTEKPDKASIKQWIKGGGTPPEGYYETEEETLSIRQPSKKKEQSEKAKAESDSQVTTNSNLFD